MPKVKYSKPGLAGDRDFIPIEDPELHAEYNDVLWRWMMCKRDSFYQAMDKISPKYKQQLDTMCTTNDEEMRKFAEKLGIAAEKYCLEDKTWETCRYWRKKAIVENKPIKDLIEQDYLDKTVVMYASNE
eukprot:TRINITY_DN939_c0_g1_i3.p4 TRINITY_DN939_c0_g1~~TRINITY_DN939_c0_g1_i3.p4  ORF type:complete len:129 (-),score=17.01 TRINITY_DN939_c0_g1_i3:150-536(-)